MFNIIAIIVQFWHSKVFKKCWVSLYNKLDLWQRWGRPICIHYTSVNKYKLTWRQNNPLPFAYFFVVIVLRGVLRSLFWKVPCAIWGASPVLHLVCNGSVLFIFDGLVQYFICFVMIQYYVFGRVGSVLHWLLMLSRQMWGIGQILHYYPWFRDCIINYKLNNKTVFKEQTFLNVNCVKKNKCK